MNAERMEGKVYGRSTKRACNVLCAGGTQKNADRGTMYSCWLQTKYLKASDINEPIGKLAEIRGLKLPEAPQEKAPIVFAVPEILIFSGLSNKKIGEFLAAYKAAGLEKIELKAVLTSQNIRWTLYQLIQEIRKEREKIEVPAK